MEKNPSRAHLPVAVQTPNLPCLSRAARRPAPELQRWQQPQRRRPDFGLPIVSRHPPHPAGRLMVRRLSSSVRTIIRHFRFGSHPPHSIHPHSIHPSRSSRALFFRCLGPAARDRAGAAKRESLNRRPRPSRPVSSDTSPSPAALDLFLGRHGGTGMTTFARGLNATASTWLRKSSG